MDMDLEQKAIMRLREAADTSERFYKAPLIVTTSGGKDSSVCVALAEKAGIDFVVGVKRFDPYIPAWCPKLSKNGGVKQ